MTRTKQQLYSSPVRVARNRLAKTIDEAADAAGVHWQAWYLTECGVYNDVPPSINSYLRKNDVAIDGADYTKWRRSRQREFGERHSLATIGLPEPSSRICPFLSFREWIGISRLELAKSLCVQPAVLYKLETGQSRHLPQQLAEALEVAGLPVELIDELNDRTEEFYEFQT